MKIGFDAKRLFNNSTGLGNYSRYVVSALSAHYPDNQYFLYTPSIKNLKNTKDFLEASNYRVQLPSGLYSKSFLKSFWRSWLLGNIAANDGIDVFHGLSHELPVTKPVGLKTVVTVHDLIFMRYPEFYSSIDVNIYTWKLKRAVKSADRIIAISEQTKSDLVHFLHVDPSQVDVVYQGCNSIFKTRHSTDEINKIRLKYALPSEFLLNVGTVEHRKNALLILQALVKMRNKLPVVIVGRKTDYVKQLNEFIHEHNIGKWVHFIHEVEFEDLPMIYQAADIFIYPSLFEGFGIPIVEAISCGTPVVSSKGSCFTEAGGPDSLYINSSNSEELASVLDELIEDDVLRKSMISKSMDYIKKFEPQVIAADLMNVYKKIN
ncbi:MAG: glycosyltransferase family 4 protein [Flammeovirgaceae bacterium]|nr:glycosyltransferase family 4 protein [Flammeovirgaceae bacterium]